MTAALPPSVRAAAGLAARTLDEARALPRRLVSLPVLMAGAAMQASLRLQQEYAGLVARGDELLVNLRGGGDDAPPWATFDDDPAAETDLRGRAGVTPPSPVPPPPATRRGTATPRRAAVESILAAPDGETSPFDRELAAHPVTDLPVSGSTVTNRTIDSSVVGSDVTEPPVIGYDDWTVAQLRARLRRLPAIDLAPLLAYEQAHRARAAYLTMLQNRLTATEKG